MADEYGYFVQTQEIIPPLSGKYKWAAKVTYVIKNPGADFQRINIPHHEHWGITKEEAVRKAKAEADEWIAAQLRQGTEDDPAE